MKLQEGLRSLLAAPPAADEDRSRSAQTINTLCLVLLVGLLPIVAHNGFSRNWTMAGHRGRRPGPGCSCRSHWRGGEGPRSPGWRSPPSWSRFSPPSSS